MVLICDERIETMSMSLDLRFRFYCLFYNFSFDCHFSGCSENLEMESRTNRFLGRFSIESNKTLTWLVSGMKAHRCGCKNE